MAEHKELVRETLGGRPYEYYALGRYVVSAPAVCGGRPTFKHTRIDVRHAIGLLATGRTVEDVAEAYGLDVEAVQEAISLAGEALEERSRYLAEAA